MNFIVNELRHRAHLKTPKQIPNNAGGFDRSYETILSFWMALENESGYLKAIRGENAEEGITQIGKARFSTFENLGASFSKGFSEGFDNIPDINPVKANYFLFVENGNINRSRLFKIIAIAKDEIRKEWIRMQLQEIEEQGTGAKT